MDIVYLKLVTGENVISYAEVDEEYVHTYRPIQLHVVNSLDGALIRTTKWIPFTNENDFPILQNKIIIIAKPSEEIQNYYLRTLDVLDENDDGLLLEEKNEYVSIFDSEEDPWENEDAVLAFHEFTANTEIKVH